MSVEIRSVCAISARVTELNTASGKSWVAFIDFATKLDNTGFSMTVFGNAAPTTTLPDYEIGVVRPVSLSFFWVKKVFFSEVEELSGDFGTVFSMTVCIDSEEGLSSVKLLTAHNNFNFKKGDVLVTFGD
jgi:hypothetical protein